MCASNAGYAGLDELCEDLGLDRWELLHRYLPTEMISSHKFTKRDSDCIVSVHVPMFTADEEGSNIDYRTYETGAWQIATHIIWVDDDTIEGPVLSFFSKAFQAHIRNWEEHNDEVQEG